MSQQMSPAEVAQHFAEANAVFGGQPEVKQDPLARFVAIHKRLREIEEEEERLKQEAQLLQERILDEWADRGQKNATLNGMRVYVHQIFYCNKRGDVPTAAVCDALTDIGLGDMVAPAYNSSRLKGMVKEWAETDQVPEELKRLLSYDTKIKLEAVKA